MSQVPRWIPKPQPIFHLIQARGQVKEAEMYQVFNMGVGFCVVTVPPAAAHVHAIVRQHGITAYDLGHWVRPKKLVSAGQALVLAES